MSGASRSRLLALSPPPPGARRTSHGWQPASHARRGAWGAQRATVGVNGQHGLRLGGGGGDGARRTMTMMAAPCAICGGDRPYARLPFRAQLSRPPRSCGGRRAISGRAGCAQHGRPLHLASWPARGIAGRRRARAHFRACRSNTGSALSRRLGRRFSISRLTSRCLSRKVLSTCAA